MRYKYIFLIFFSFLILKISNANIVFQNNNDSIAFNEFKRASDFYKKSEFEKAEQSFINTIRRLKNSKGAQSELLLKSYLNYAVLLFKLGKLDNSLKLSNKAEDICINLYGMNTKYLIPIFSNKANIYSSKLEYSRSIEYLEKCIDLSEKLKIRRYLAKLYNNLGTIYYKADNYLNSLKYYKKSLVYKNKKSSIALSYTNIANTYKKIQNYKDAEIYYAKAIDIAKNIKNKTILIRIFQNYSVFLGQKGDDNKFIENIKLTLKYCDKYLPKKNKYRAKSNLNLSYYYYYKKDYSNSLYYVQEALKSSFELFSSDEFNDNPKFDISNSTSSNLEIISLKSQCLFQAFEQTNDVSYLKLAAKSFDLSIRIIENLRIGYLNEDSKLKLSETEEETYNKSIETSFLLYKKTGERKYLEDCFKYSEKYKASSLASSINNKNAKLNCGIPPEMKANEDFVKSKMNRYYKLIHDLNFSSSSKQYKDSLFKYKLQYEKLIRKYEEQFPEYYELKYSKKTISINTLKEKLNDNQSIIEYRLSDNKLYTFLISKDKQEVWMDRIDSIFYDNINKLKLLLNKFEMGSNLDHQIDEFGKVSNYLYNMLINKHINIEEKRELIIIPDRELCYIPFEILLKSKKYLNQYNYKNLDYLLKYNPISYSNSASIAFGQAQSKNPKANNKLLAMAPKYDNISDSILVSDRNFNKILYPLRYTKKEVRAIQKSFDGHILVDKQATETSFKENAKNYGILHLAMHAIVDNENPMLSKLIFSKDSSIYDDGLLNLYEIYNLDLNAWMVVLSACSTGDGRLQKGEGVMSLSRGFVFAGCRSILMTLWTVDDKTGAMLMDKYYQNLENHSNKAVSLQKAKLDFLQNADALRSHPYFWSGYICYGDIEPLVADKWDYNIYFCLSILFFIVIFSAILIAINKLKFKL
ncbi:MAG: CHAT domain-containing protein [Marinifilaceae bacterium]|jgi:CHAT domain-containing protein/tetratricopeptide (TPR) repeat protein|nr:CHAT domain-containing protein [Marinifilaceae bacterium]